MESRPQGLWPSSRSSFTVGLGFDFAVPRPNESGRGVVGSLTPRTSMGAGGWNTGIALPDKGPVGHPAVSVSRSAVGAVQHRPVNAQIAGRASMRRTASGLCPHTAQGVLVQSYRVLRIVGRNLTQGGDASPCAQSPQVMDGLEGVPRRWSARGRAPRNHSRVCRNTGARSAWSVRSSTRSPRAAPITATYCAKR